MQTVLLKDQVVQPSPQAIAWDLATWQSTVKKRVLLFLRLQKIQKSKFITNRHSGQIRKLLLSRKKTNYHYEDAMLLASFSISATFSTPRSPAVPSAD